MTVTKTSGSLTTFTLTFTLNKAKSGMLQLRACPFRLNAVQTQSPASFA